MLSKIICFLFGHRPAFGCWGREGEGYFRQRVGVTDGTRRVHISLHSECERCGKDYQVGMIHHLREDELK